MRLLLLFLVTYLSLVPVLASEEITDYHCDISIQTDGALLIRETIRVKAEQQAIRRGIYRDFPTRYHRPDGSRYNTSFEVISVSRDGKPEPWHQQARSNGERVYIGTPEHTLTPGFYTYQITYRTQRQITFLADNDELYFNAIGHGFSFPIQQARVTITLPAAIPFKRWRAYTGQQGSHEQAATVIQPRPGQLHVEVERVLRANEGVTIVANWPKGVIQPPTAPQQWRWWLSDYVVALIAILAWLVLLVYLLIRWYQIGRDPKAGSIIPLFSPPAGLSPAACYYVYHQHFSPIAFSAAIVSMAVKGHLNISENDNKGEFQLSLSVADTPLSRGEQAVQAALFAQAGTTLTLAKRHDRRVERANDRLKGSLKQEYGHQNFRLNIGSFLIGLLLAIVGFVTMTLVVNNATYAGQALFAAAFSFPIFKYGVALFSRPHRRLRTFLMLFFNALVLAAILYMMPAGQPLASIEQMALLLYAIGCCFLLTLFYWLLQAPTLSGRKLLDQLEGFRLYLSVAEQALLSFQHPPEQTPELFARYLPYAIALGVENQWGERFSAVLTQAQAANDPALAWYHHSASPHHFSSQLGNGLSSSLSSTIAAAATAPSSSSGFSGFSGGSSGGGGGGGGGGGW